MIFKVWNPENSDEEDVGQEIEALDAAAAAEKWAELDDANDCGYYIAQHPDDPTMCMVKPIGDGHLGHNGYNLRYFRVRGERVNRYTASEV